MLSLLSPFSLWLGAALTVPLAIHFLGRQRLKKQPFPSLLLVQERFSKSMHTHRLKNILLLIIRTLLILCLILALSNPVWNKSKAAFLTPKKSLVLIHNGIYGLIQSEKEKSLLQFQKDRIRILDSVWGIHSQTIPIVPVGPGKLEALERFGDYKNAIRQLQKNLPSRDELIHIHIPVFSWNDLQLVDEELNHILEQFPNLQISLLDFTPLLKPLQSILELKTTPELESPIVNIQASIHPTYANARENKVQVYLNGQMYQDLAPQLEGVNLKIPLGEKSSTVGRFSTPGNNFVAPNFFFCFPHSGKRSLAHIGSALTSLPSLGRETYFRRIIHVGKGKDLPTSKLSELTLIYFANSNQFAPETYTFALNLVRQGGSLIIGVGNETDIPTLNRFLVQPLGLGRLGQLQNTDINTQVTYEKSGLEWVGSLPKNWGAIGNAYKRITFSPEPGTQTLLKMTKPNYDKVSEDSKQIADAGIILAGRDFHRGKVLLWTTDIDNLDWSDLGVGPIVPLIHQSLQSTGSSERAKNFSIASDSQVTLTFNPQSLESSADQQVNRGSEKVGISMLDPEGRAFNNYKREGQRLRIGPFDKLGIYKVIKASDTTVFAVNLASQIERPSTEKEDVLKQFLPYKKRILVIPSDATISANSFATPLWPILVLIAILLLFLEGLIASTFNSAPKK